MAVDLRTLRAFVEVVRQDGFSAAAKVLFASQPTVTKAVQQLEDELGASLLLRVGHNIHLTELGNVVYQRAIVMLNERDHLLEEIAELRELQRGTLRIGLPTVGSSILFAPLFAEFRKQHPSIDIILEEHGSARLEELILQREIDLGAMLLPVGDSLEWQEVCNDPLMLLLPPGHALAGRQPVRLSDLASCNFILFEKGFRLNEVIEEACHKRGFSPQVTARSSQPDFIISLVAAGLGIAMLPRVVTNSRVNPAVQITPMDEKDLRWRLGMVWRKGSDLPPSARAWLQLAKTYTVQRKNGESLIGA
jgi:DNA-binding transcriptional LysR family regulator